MATAVHPVQSVADWLNPNVVKVVADAEERALLFSRAPLPWSRSHLPGGWMPAPRRPGRPLRRPSPCGTSACMPIAAASSHAYAQLDPCALEDIEALEQLRVLHHGYRIKLLHTDDAPPAGVDTPADLERVRARLDTAPTDAQPDSSVSQRRTGCVALGRYNGRNRIFQQELPPCD